MLFKRMEHNFCMNSNNKSPHSRTKSRKIPKPEKNLIATTAMEIFVVTLGHEFAIEISNQAQILEIKRKIEQFIGIPVESQHLSVYGCELIDGLDMEDYQFITEGWRIDLSIDRIAAPPPIKIPITVKLSNRQIDVEIEETETVHSLKEKIQKIDGTPVQSMSLFHSGKELSEDYRNLSEFGVGEFSEVIVIYRLSDFPGRKVSFVVKTSSSLLNEACIPMEMMDSSTVGDVGELLLAGKVLPDDDYLFIHKQRIMRDKCSLRWHGVENGDFIYVFKGTVSRAECY